MSGSRPSWYKPRAPNPTTATTTTAVASNSTLLSENNNNANVGGVIDDNLAIFMSRYQYDTFGEENAMFELTLIVRNLPLGYTYHNICEFLPSYVNINPLTTTSWVKNELLFYKFTFSKLSHLFILFDHFKSYTYKKIPISLSLYRALGSNLTLSPQQESFCFFGKTITNKLLFDNDATYSVSPQQYAIFAMLLILLFTPRRNQINTNNDDDGRNNVSIINTNNLHQNRHISIMDGCACVGGDTIAFSKMPLFERLYALLQISLLTPTTNSDTNHKDNGNNDVGCNDNNCYNKLDFNLYKSLPTITTTVSAIEYDLNRSQLLQQNIQFTGMSATFNDLLAPNGNPNLKLNSDCDNSLNNSTKLPIVDVKRDSFVFIARPELRTESNDGDTNTDVNQGIDVTNTDINTNHDGTNDTINNTSTNKNTKTNENDSKIDQNNKFYPQVLFLDPPWGGKNYLVHDLVKLQFDIHSVGDLLYHYIKSQYSGINIDQNDTNNFQKKKNATEKTELIVLKCPNNVDVDDLVVPILKYRRQLYQAYLNDKSNQDVDNHDKNNHSTLSSFKDYPISDSDSCFIQRIIAPKITYLLICVPDLDKVNNTSSNHNILPTQSTPRNPYEMLLAIINSNGVTNATSFIQVQSLLSQLLLTSCLTFNSNQSTIKNNDAHNSANSSYYGSQLWIERIVEAWGCSYDLFQGQHYTSHTVPLLKLPQWYQHDSVDTKDNINNTHAHENSSNNTIDENNDNNVDENNNNNVDPFFEDFKKFNSTLGQDAALNEFSLGNTFNCVIDIITLNESNNIHNKDQDEQMEQDCFYNSDDNSLLLYTPNPLNNTPGLIVTADNPLRDVNIEYKLKTGFSPPTSRQEQHQQGNKKTYTPRSNLRIPISTNNNYDGNNPKENIQVPQQFKADVKSFSAMLGKSLANDNNNNSYRNAPQMSKFISPNRNPANMFDNTEGAVATSRMVSDKLIEMANEKKIAPNNNNHSSQVNHSSASGGNNTNNAHPSDQKRLSDDSNNAHRANRGQYENDKRDYRNDDHSNYRNYKDDQNRNVYNDRDRNDDHDRYSNHGRDRDRYDDYNRDTRHRYDKNDRNDKYYDDKHDNRYRDDRKSRSDGRRGRDSRDDRHDRDYRGDHNDDYRCRRSDHDYDDRGRYNDRTHRRDDDRENPDDRKNRRDNEYDNRRDRDRDYQR